METVHSPKINFVGLPFYIFITVLLAGIAVFGGTAIVENRPDFVYIYALTFLLHIGLYWSNVKLYQNEKWLIFYHVVQAVFILVLALFPYGNDDVQSSVLITTTICMIGACVGFWGNTRRSLWLALSYAALAILLVYFLVDREHMGIALSNLLVNGGVVVIFLIVLNQQILERQRATELAESLESANAKLAASTAKVESLTLQNERQRMARELHDTLAQGVAGLVLQLEAVKSNLASHKTDRAAQIVDQAIAHARRTLAESRAAIDDLRAAPENLSESVREKIERFKQATGIPCDMEISIHENQLPAETTNHALNILSESLTNVARHAQATQVHVKWKILGRMLELEVLDNGKGFDMDQQVSGHYGLVGMHERARLCGGSLEVESAPHGTCIRFIVERPA